MKVQWKRVVPVLAVAGMLLLPMSVATATVINVDGNIGDWVQNVAAIYSAANPTFPVANGGSGNPLAFAAHGDVASWGVGGLGEDGPGLGDYVGPGYGGQNYDVEAMYAFYDNVNPIAANQGLYVAVVTGFDPDGVRNWSNGDPTYLPGDLFFDFGSNGVYDLAVSTSNDLGLGMAYTPNGDPWYTMGVAYSIGPNQIIGSAATPAGAVSAYLFSDKVVGGFANVSDIGAINVPDQWDNQTTHNGPYASNNPADWNRYDHNVMEVFLSEAWLAARNIAVNGPITVREYWTEDCGNDYGSVPSVTVPQVPEPVTMVMLGCLGAGMLGARAAARRRKTEK
jgi:hypothetical protein